MAKQSSTPKIATKKHIARLERERRQANIIRGIALAGILIVAGLLAYGYLNLNFLQQRQAVAEVNGDRVTIGDWQERVRYQRVQMLNVYNQYSFYQQNFGLDYTQQLQQLAAQLQSPELIGQQVLDQMIDEALIRQEAEKRGITVSAAEVEKTVQENFGFFPNGTPTPTITPTEFSTPTISSEQLTIYPSTSTPTEAPTSTPEATATIDMSATPVPTSTQAPATPTFVPEPPTATATPYTLEGFQSQYDETVKNFKTYNISEKTVRSVFEAELLRQKLTEVLTKDIPPSEEQAWARHILVETEVEAKTVYEQLKQGASFEKVAKESSKDTGSGAGGGDLGWFGRGAMVAEFEEAAFSQKVGEIGEPVKSEFGYHIIQVIAREERPLDATQYEQKKQIIVSDWLTTARESAELTTFDIWRERVPTEPALGTPQQ